MTAPSEAPEGFRSLLRAARKGDDEAWAVLYRWLSPQILGFLRTARMADPEDVLGDVFLEVAARIGDFRGDGRGFRAWVFTIARARRVDDIRRRSRRPEDRWDTAEHGLVPAVVDVETEVLGTLVLDELLIHLEALTDDQAEVLLLRAIGGLTAPEVAEVTGRSVGAVEQLQHRATTALRQKLRKEAGARNDPLL